MSIIDAEDLIFTVPEKSDDVTFTFSGEAQTDRNKVVGIPAGGRDMVVEWMAPNGAQLAKGDRMVVFSAVNIERQLPVRAADLATDEGNIKLSELRLDQDMASLLEEQRLLRADLRACRAAMASAAVSDASKVAVAKVNVDLAAQRAEELASAAERQRQLHAAGQISDSDLKEAEDAAELAKLDLRLPELDLRLAEKPTTTLALDKLRLRERTVIAQLGLDEHDQPIPTQGINGRIAALKSQQQRQREANAMQRDKSAINFHNVQRDAHDHTPVDWIEISGPTKRSVCFQPKGEAWKEDFSVDSGEIYDEGRGYGWLADASANMLLRSPARRSPAVGLALIERQNTWRALLQDGRYHVRVGFGDQFDWDGAIARLATSDGPQADALFVSRRVDPRAFPIAEADIEVRGGHLDVIFGDTCVRAIRAPDRGVAIQRPWMRLGIKTRGAQSLYAFFSDPRQINIRARLHQDLVALIRERDAKAADAEAPRTVQEAQARIATSVVELSTPSGESMRGDISSISNQPVPLTRAPDDEIPPQADLSANELLIAIGSDDAAKLHGGDRVECQVRLALDKGMFAVPAYLVENVDNRAYVQEIGSRMGVEVKAFRVGDQAVVWSGLSAGMRLMPVRNLPRERTPEKSFSGVVKAGTRTPLTLQASSGRIKDMVEDGAMVTAGQIVITLINPGLEDQRATLEQDKRKANQTYLLAMEARQVKNVQAAVEHRGKLLQEQAADLAYQEALTVDPMTSARSDVEAAKNDRVAARAQETAKALAELSHRDPSRLAAATADAKRAEIAARNARLSLCAAARSLDWFAIRAAAYAWQDALAALSLREAELKLARIEEQVGNLSAKLRLAQALEGSRWERDFNRVKDMKAAVSGRLFYRVGWNDQTNASGKYQRDFQIWAGTTVADILDMDHLSFTAEIPESQYRNLAEGQQVVIEFAQFNNRRLEATISAIGRAFAPPRDRTVTDRGSQAIANDRVFTVEVSFTPPPELKDILVPGTKGTLVLP